MSQDVVHRIHRALLRVRGPVDEPLDPRQHHRAGAHRARLQRDVNRDPFQPPRLRHPGGLVEHQHLGMGGGVGGGFDQVVGFGQDRTIADQHRTDRHLTDGRGAAGLRQGTFHVMGVVRRTGG